MIRELKYLKKIIRSSFGRLDFPHKISYIVTYRCNLRCKMCNIWKKKNDVEMPMGEIDEFFKRSNSFSWVGITGGEPFLRPDIADIAGVIAGRCRDLTALHFATNGTLTGAILETTEYLLRNNRGRLKLLFTLSMDGDARLHDQIRGVEGTWNKCLDTFRELRKIPAARARFGITLSPHNTGRFKDIFQSLKRVYPFLRFDDITVNVMHKSSFYYDNTDMVDPDQAALVKDIDGILEDDRDRFTVNNFLRRRYLHLYKVYAQRKKCPLPCQALSATCVLDPRGDIYPCGIYNMKVANIREFDYDLRKIWSLPRARTLSAQCAQSRCPSCWSPCDAYSAIVSSLFRSSEWRT